MKTRPAFSTEAELCAAFLARIDDGWIAYAETAGWDILLVRKVDGVQIGIEAKLKLNAHVVAQAMEGLQSTWTKQGPDYRAILVPEFATVKYLGGLASAIGITVIHTGHDSSYRRFRPDLPIEGRRYSADDWHEWCPTERHPLPGFVPDVVAGSSAPVQLTTWKVGALKIAAVLEVRGVVQRIDFKFIGINAQRWTDKWTGWLKASPAGYVAGTKMPDFKGQHPKVFAELLATFDDWAPPQSPTPSQQPSLLEKPA